MVLEFARRSGLPSFYFQATNAPAPSELAEFAGELGRSGLPDVSDLSTPTSWPAALRQLADVLPGNGPTIVVLDEAPYLARNDPGFEGALQAAWDQRLSLKPLLLILIGSNRAEMERLTTAGRPFYQRATEMPLGPLTVADVKELTGLDAADAIDAYLVTGGLPLILADWQGGMSIREFLRTQVCDSLSPLVVSGERMLTSEFPSEVQAKTVLRAIGSGEATFGGIQSAAGGIKSTSLSRSLKELIERQVVVADAPLSCAPSTNTRYRIEDPFMRFWLPFLADGIPRIEAGQSDLVLQRIERAWASWRGRVVEPVLRELLAARRDLLPDGTAEVGGWWTRRNDVEVDLVGADRWPVARTLTFFGSIKWRENREFTSADLSGLRAACARVPGATGEAPLVAMSRTSVAPQVLAQGVTAITADDLV